MTCWFLLVPSGLPVLVSLLVSSFCPQERGSVPSCFAASSWFRLRFRCLSPFFSLLWFRCLSPFFSLLSSSGKGFCSIMICWFFLVPAGVPVLVSLILSSLVPVLVSLLFSSFFPQDRGSVPSRLAGSSWFRLGFRCLSPFFSLLSFLTKGVLFHHDLLVPLGSGGVPVLVSLLLTSLVPVLVSLLLCCFFPQEIRHPLCFSLCLPLCFPLCLQFVSNFVPDCVFHFVSHFVSTLFANLSLAFVSSVYPLLSSCWPPPLCLPLCIPLRLHLCPALCLAAFCHFIPPPRLPSCHPLCLFPCLALCFFFPLCLQLCPSLCLKLCLPLRRSHCLSHRLRAQSKNVAQTWSLPGTFPL